MISKLLETILNIVIKSKRQSFQVCDYSGLDTFLKSIPLSPSCCHCLILFSYHFHGISHSAAISHTLSTCPSLMSSNPPSIPKDQNSYKTYKTSQLASRHLLKLSSILCMFQAQQTSYGRKI